MCLPDVPAYYYPMLSANVPDYYFFVMLMSNILNCYYLLLLLFCQNAWLEHSTFTIGRSGGMLNVLCELSVVTWYVR